MSAALIDAERAEDRAWREKGVRAEVAAQLLVEGNDRLAREYAEQWRASHAWWVEAAQQVRDVRRLEDA
jgi:hypothetical protein